MVRRYTPAKRYRTLPNSSTTLKPMGDGISRRELEEELFGVRAMRHVFRVRPNASMQAWVTLLNPVVPHGYPAQVRA